MADALLTSLPLLAIPGTGTYLYSTDTNNQSYKTSIGSIAPILITNYNLLTSVLNSSLMTSTNAEIILAGLNNASVAKLGPDRVDLSSLFFDIDGGTFFDTYINTSTFDGGSI